MADRFDDLGIAPALASAAGSLGWDAPTGLQRDAIPVIRRGNNVVLHASAGSGHVGAYGLGLLDQLAAATDADTNAAPRALVLVLDDAAAARTAESLAHLAAPADLAVSAAGPGWSHAYADVLVLTPAAAVAAIRDSALKLEGLASLVIDGLDQVRATGQAEDLETVIDITPGEAQRVVVTGAFDRQVDDFIERHARRSMTVPGRSGESEGDRPGTGITVRYRVVQERSKAAAVAALLRPEGPAAGAGSSGVESGAAGESGTSAAETAVVVRTAGGVEALTRVLDARGLSIGSDGRDGGRRILVLSRSEADRRSTKADVISADVPFDADELAELHARGGVVLVAPREREHLLRIGRRAGIKLRAMADPAPAGSTAADAVRERLRELLAGPALAADLALIEPLLDDYPAAEVAAAALHLARTGTVGASDPRPAGAQAAPGARPAAGAGRPGAGAPPPSETTTWTHLFVTAGSRDDISPGDILGAMTGEAGIDAGQVGKIDVRESHTTVEVATPVAARVIEALNGRTMKGRSLRVDYDRKSKGGRQGDGGSRGGGRGGGTGGARRPGAGRGGGGARGGPRR